MDSIDGLIDQINYMSQRSSGLTSTNRNLLGQLDGIEKDITDKENNIEQLSTRIQNSQIFLRHLTSLTLRCDFLDKQLSTLEETEVKDGSISATRNLGIHEFRQWKENSLNWKTAETTLENLTTEYEYLITQLQQTTTSYEEPHYRNISMDASTEVSNNTSLFSSNNTDSVTLSSTLAESSVIKDHPLEIPHKPAKRDAKHHLLKMESFLTIPYEQRVAKNPSEEISQPALKHFRISSLHEKKSAEEMLHCTSHSNSTAAVSSGKAVSSPPSFRRGHGRMSLSILPLLEEQGEKEKKEKKTDDKADDKTVDKTDDNHTSKPSNATESSSYQHTRRLSLPDNKVAPEDGMRHWILSSSVAQVQSPDVNYYLGPDRKKQGKKLKHFVSHATGLSLVKEGLKLRQFTFPSKPVTSIVNIPEEPVTEEDDYGNENATPLDFSSDEDEDVEDEANNTKVSGLTLTGNGWAATNTIREDSSSGYSYTDSDHSKQFEDDLSILEPHKFASRIKRTRSHESIFDDYQRDHQIRENSLRRLDLKAQTLKWLKPSAPVVSSSNEVIAANPGHNKVDVEGVISSSLSRLSVKGDGESDKASTVASVTQPINIATNSDSHWWQNMLPGSAMVTSETGTLIGQRVARSVASNSDDKMMKHRYGHGRSISSWSHSNNYAANGSCSTMVIGRNGSRMINHGSNFTGNVLSSRVSQNALHEALESEII